MLADTLMLGDWPLFTEEQLFSISILATGWIFMGLIGSGIGHVKRRAGLGFFLGLMLGPVGWLLIAFFEADGKRCPFCCSVVPKEALICKHCRSELRPGENPFT